MVERAFIQKLGPIGVNSCDYYGLGGRPSARSIPMPRSTGVLLSLPVTTPQVGLAS